MTLEISSLLKNRYRIDQVIARGGMGAIYAAFDESLSVRVAVKENLITSEDATRQFRREASILASLHHLNLPRVTDHFVIPDQGQYLVMDYIEGEDLKERITRSGTLSEKETTLIGIAISDALAYMHSRKPCIVHRDIKPGNIKISPSGEVFLVDFGIAKISQPDHGTTVGAQSLTPGFAPPEQYGQGTDPRSDVYSLGATLYNAVTGLVPANGLSRLMKQQDLTPIREVNSAVSQGLADVIEKALQVQKEDRYQTADEMKRDLLAVLHGSQENNPIDTISVEPAPTQTGTRRFGAPVLLPEPVSQTKEQAIPVKKTSSRSNLLFVGMVFVFFIVAAILAGFVFDIFPITGIARNTPSTPASAIIQPSETFIYLPASSTPESPTVEPPAATTVVQNTVMEQSPTGEPAPVDSPTPVATPQGGGSGQILFVSDRTGKPQLFIMNSDGTDLQQITNELDGACQPDWSPDGTRIVFVSPCKAQSKVYPQDEVYRGAILFIINADGTSRMPIASLPGGDFDPAWSPDGTQILFASYRDNLTSTDLNLYNYDLSSNTVTVLTKDLNSDRRPAWSPDGQNIVFQRQPQGGSPQINVMSRDGTEIYIFTDQQQNNSFMPDWGIHDTILFSRGKSLPEPFVRALSPRNAPEPRLSQDNAWDMDYSPDGNWVVFERAAFLSDNTRNDDIYLMSSLGDSVFQLTDDPARDYQPVWKP